MAGGGRGCGGQAHSAVRVRAALALNGTCGRRRCRRPCLSRYRRALSSQQPGPTVVLASWAGVGRRRRTSFGAARCWLTRSLNPAIKDGAPGAVGAELISTVSGRRCWELPECRHKLREIAAAAAPTGGLEAASGHKSLSGRRTYRQIGGRTYPAPLG